MPGFDNNVVFADNVDFTGGSPVQGKVTADGQLLIGSTASPNIRVANLTPGTGIQITDGPGSITISSTASLTDLHTAKWIVNPIANSGGNQTTIQGAINAASSGDTIFIMPKPNGEAYTENLTLKAGVNLVGFSGDQRTPNVTIVGKLTATFSGTCTISNIRLQTNSDNLLVVSGSSATIAVLTNCFLNCSNNTGISFTSSNSSSIIAINNCTGDIGTTGISLFDSSSSGTLSFIQSTINNSGGSSTANTISSGLFSSNYSAFANPITTSGTAAASAIYTSFSTEAQNVTALTSGGSGSHSFDKCRFASGTASAISISNTCGLFDCTVTSSNTNAITGAGTVVYSNLTFISTSSNINTTTQTVRNTGPSLNVGSSNSGNTNTLTVLNSSNTASSSSNIVSSVAGSTAADPTFQSTTTTTTWTWGSDNSVTSPTADPWVLSQGTALGTNNVMSVATSGEINYPLQPAFLAQASAQSNVTGAGTGYTVLFDTEIFDQNSDFSSPTFTAPVTGRFTLGVSWNLTGLTAAMTIGTYDIVTSNRTYRMTINSGAIRSVANSHVIFNSILADMDAADTSTAVVTISNGAGDVASIGTFSYFYGNLQC